MKSCLPANAYAMSTAVQSLPLDFAMNRFGYISQRTETSSTTSTLPASFLTECTKLRYFVSFVPHLISKLDFPLVFRTRLCPKGLPKNACRWVSAGEGWGVLGSSRVLFWTRELKSRPLL